MASLERCASWKAQVIELGWFAAEGSKCELLERSWQRKHKPFRLVNGKRSK